jgi:hypothetical protein
MQIKLFLRENALFIGVIIALLVAFLLLRTRGTKLASLDEFDALITTGSPAVIEFFGNT